jgi:hypothetical protein
VLAEEVQNVREFGPQIQPRSVETYLSGRMEMFTAQLGVTTEFQRCDARAEDNNVIRTVTAKGTVTVMLAWYGRTV